MNAPAMLRRPIRRAPIHPPFRLVIKKQPTVMLYYPGEPNRCQSCGNGGFEVGRTSATCSNCGRPMPLAHRDR